MIIQPKSKTKEEITAHFKGKVVSFERKEEYALHFRYLNKFRGHISNDKFWITKESYSPYGAGRRYFIGEIIEKDDGVVIDGNFRFHSSVYFIFCFIIILVPFIFCIENHSFKPYLEYMIVMLFFAGIVYLILLFSNMKREEEIEKLLENL